MSIDDSIVLKPYSEAWSRLAQEEIATLERLTPEFQNWKIEHIGSTSVPGLRAKPIIDLVARVPEIRMGMAAVEPLESVGYLFWKDNPDKTHMFFVKGLPPQGLGRTHHLHFFEPERYQEHLRFREALRSDPELLKEYERKKVSLAEEFKYDREAYTSKKGRFIQGVLNKNKKS